MKNLLMVATMLSLASYNSKAERVEFPTLPIMWQSSINAAIEKQTKENAQGHYSSVSSEHHRQYAQAAKRRPSETACEAITAIYTEKGEDGLSQPGKLIYNQCHPEAKLAEEKF